MKSIAQFAAGIALCLACSDAAAPASTTINYQVVLQQDSIQVYGCTGTSAECMACGLYCRYWVAQSGSTSAVLSVDTVSGAATFMSHDGTMTASAGVTMVAIQMNIYCDYIGLTGTRTATAFQGTWGEQLDCHGRSRIGTFTGSR